MRILILILGFAISLNTYSLVYETHQDGVPGFSNIKSKGAKELNLQDDPVSVVNISNISKKIVWGANKSQENYSLNRQDTMQSSFPEQFTDNYYDFYGRNHQYKRLMSSTIGMSMYSRDDANNMRLQQNY